jgi:predicted DNA-binding protein (MmcQ/YjbR family)
MQTPVHRSLVPVRRFALALPGAVEEFPWGHCAIKVNRKAFVFIGRHEDGRGTMSLKLPESVDDALERESCAPTGYGLGKSGWVTITMGQPDSPNAATLRAWILESYRAIAPKKLVAQLKA